MASALQILPDLLPAPSVRATGSPASTVFLPKEHGSWSLAFEPLAVGLLLAPSAAGAALFAAAAVGFFARRPFKAVFGAQSTANRRAAFKAVGLFSALAVVAGLELFVLGNFIALWPLLLVVPFGLLFAWFDAQGEGRAAAAEVAGSAAFAMLPAGFATLAGWSAVAALSLAALALVRSVPTVLTIRTFLRQRKGEGASSLLPIVSAALGVGLLLQLAASGYLPWLAIVGAEILLLRTLWLAGPWRPAWSARRAGMFEGVLGVIYVGLLAASGLGQIP